MADKNEVNIKQLMIIDDDEDTIYLMKNEIEKSHKVKNILCVSGGEEALEYLESHAAPAMILLDLNMPRMNGWEFLDEIVKRGLCRETYIAIVSVSENPDDHKRAHEMNYVFVTKPMTKGKFETLLDESYGDDHERRAV